MTPPESLTRRQLHELVWSKPMTKLAPELGLSNQQLANLCRSRGIPAPKAGHWTKVRAGHESPVVSLPEGLDPDEQVYPEPESERLQTPGRVAVRAQDPDLDPDVRRALERAETKLDADFFAGLQPHRVIARYRSQLRRGKQQDEPGRPPYVQPAGGGPLRTIDISTSREVNDRALDVANRILRALLACGATVKKIVSDHAWKRGESLQFLGEQFHLRVREKLRRRRFDPKRDRRTNGYSWQDPKIVYEPTGTLVITARDARSNVEVLNRTETSKRQIKDQVVDVVRRLILDVNDFRRRRAAIERMEAEARERERRRFEEKLRQREGQARREQLLNMVRRWEETERLRRFLAACRDRGVPAEVRDDFGSEAEWLQWVKQIADDIDPLG